MPPLVLLAGGASRRMGRPKAALPFFGRTWIEAQIEAFEAAGGREVIAVVPAPTALDGARAIVQPRPDDAPWSSLQLALAEVSGPLFVLPIDVPVGPSVWATLAGAIGAHEAAVPAVDGVRAHPVLLSCALVERLRTIDGGRLDHELARADCVTVPVAEPVIRLNLNTPEAWAAWLASADARRCYPREP